MFSFLGILHSKINLLFTSLNHSIILKGFRLIWSEQTGFNSEELSSKTQKCISQTSLNLQRLVLVSSLQKFHSQLDQVFGLYDLLPPFIWSRGVQNYRFLFRQYSVKHQKKLVDIVDSVQLEHLFPEISFVAQCNINVNDLISKLPRGTQTHSTEAMVADPSKDTVQTLGYNEEIATFLNSPADDEHQDESVNVAKTTEKTATLRRSFVISSQTQSQSFLTVCDEVDELDQLDNRSGIQGDVPHSSLADNHRPLEHNV